MPGKRLGLYPKGAIEGPEQRRGMEGTPWGPAREDDGRCPGLGGVCAVGQRGAQVTGGFPAPQEGHPHLI